MKDILSHKLANTLQADLMLAAKAHYADQVLDRLEAARLIAAVHIGMHPEHFPMQALSYWLLKEFVESKVLFKTPDKLFRFLLDFEQYNLPATYPWQHRLSNRILSDLSCMQVRNSNGDSLLPFDMPPKDQVLNDYLIEYAASQSKMAREEATA